MVEINDQTLIGWIGTGVMGSAMLSRLQQQGYRAHVYNRTKSKANSNIEQGATWQNSPKAIAAESDVLFTIVGFPNDVREVYFGENGILSTISEGKIVVDMTTTEPSLAQEIAQHATKKGAHAIDAPVSGGDVGAQNGQLSIMVGGDAQSVERIMPLLNSMGKNIVYQGEAGSGQHTKMCNQITIAGTMIGVCESLLYAYKAGLDATTMLSSISGGAAACWTLNNLAPRIVDRNFEPGFYVEHFIKDMGIALKEANALGLAMPGLAMVKQLYEAVQAQGHGRKGTHALMLALEHLSGIPR